MSERKKKKVVKERMPKFRSEDEERDFWAKHDVVDYFDWDKSVEGSFPALKPSTRTISLRLPQALLEEIKALANVELRSELFTARVFGEERRFGLVGFADFGRVWADYHRRPELDGDGLGIKYGVGGGLRVASGETFVLRLDVGWSPDANPVSGYLLAGHLF